MFLPSPASNHARTMNQTPADANVTTQTPRQTPSDTQLVQGCLQGDFQAWQQLVDRYARLVRTVPVRLGLSAMEVDDVAQEVFLALAQGIHRLEDPERLPAWLVTTARRLSWRALQKRQREQPSDHSELARLEMSSRSSGDPSPDWGLNALLDGWDRQARLQQAMDRLDPRCRELLHLLFLDPEEPDYAAISQRISMPLGSIGPTRGRCLAKLRAILEEMGYSEE